MFKIWKLNNWKLFGNCQLWKLEIAFFALLLSLLAAKNVDAATINRPPLYLFSNTGLVGYWTMDGSKVNWATGAVTDSSGLGNTGTITNMATSTGIAAGKIGQALNFDGADDTVSASRLAAIDYSQPYAVSFWLKADAFGKMFISQVRTDTDRFAAGLLGGGTPRLNWGHYNGTSFNSVEENAASITALQMGTWYHFVLVNNADQSKLIYRNGVLNSTISLSNQNAGASATNFLIGAATGAGQFFDGLIDEVRIYNRALSANEVATLFNSGAAKFNVSPTKYLTNGLVGYWTMDGSKVNWATGAVTDSSGRGNTGFVTNMATSTSQAIGRIGQALSFDGVDDYVNVPNSSSLALTTDGTFCTWFNAVNFTNADGELIKKDLNYLLRTKDDTNLDLTFLWWDGPNIKLIHTAHPSTGAWHHVCATVSSNVPTGLYLDGILKTTTVTTPSASTRNTANVLTIGAASGGGEPFNGKVDEVRVYNRALSANEVATLFNSGAAKFNVSPTKYLTDGLVGYWTMDGSKVNWATGAVTDSSGKGNTGFVTNMATSTAQAIGKVGQALNFDGVNDYVNVPNSSSLALTTDGTFCTWFNAVNFTNADGELIKKDLNYLLRTKDDTNLDLTFLWWDGPNIKLIHTAHPSTGAWHHVCATVSSNVPTGLYLDGILKTTTVTTPSASTRNTANVLTIGAASGGGEPFNGKVDEVRVYNRALSANEILQLYNAGR